MLAQMGRMNHLAISGGRITVESDYSILLPVASGYWVRVTYNPVPDLYTVERLYKRKGQFTVKASVDRVYAMELGEIAYRASCYHDPM